jgi:hypothetical protein
LQNECIGEAEAQMDRAFEHAVTDLCSKAYAEAMMIFINGEAERIYRDYFMEASTYIKFSDLFIRNLF